jgi:predicted phosphodiesterase
MQRIIADIPSNCEIIIASCTHIGSQLCHYRAIDNMVKFVKAKPNRRFIHLGDIIEAITTDDKRYHVEGMKQPIPLLQIQEAMEIFRPIREQIIAVLGGNHELKLHRFGNLASLFCSEKSGINVPYGTRTARVVFQNEGKRIFNGFFTHDVPVFRSRAKDFLQRQANILAAMKMSMQYRMGDCAVMICGHAHQLLVVPPSPMLYLTDGETSVKQHYLEGDLGNGGFINPDQRWYGCAGSFRKKYQDGIDDYSDIYYPVEIGYLILTIQDNVIKSLEKKVV